jgi:hypothetical protein
MPTAPCISRSWPLALLLVGLAQLAAGGELDAWQAADDCTDYRAFLADYPNGKLAALAKQRLLSCPAEPPPTAPQPVPRPVAKPEPVQAPPNRHVGVPAAQITEAQARALVERLIAASNSTNVDAMVALFTDPARYFGWGLTSHAKIRQDKRAYFHRWPRVHYELAAPPRILPTGGADLRVDMALRYEVSSPERNQRVGGTTHNTLIVGLVRGSPRIKAMHETVLSREQE